MNGWAGNLLRVNLSDGSIDKEKLDKEILHDTIGGMGTATRYLFDELKGKIEPLSEENKVIIFAGPFAGTPIASSGRFCMVTTSPLTNYFLQSHCGGHFGPEMKYSELDGIIIEGRADDPVYLLIEDDHYELKTADKLWGRGVKATTSTLERDNDPESKILAIGPAGERQIPISNVKSDVYRSLGRGGTGAVFGSKNLKAIVARGNGKIDVSDPEYVKDHILRAKESTYTNAKGFVDFGTTNTGGVVHHAGGLPTRNFSRGKFETIDNISGTNYVKSIWKGRRACFGCPIGCSHFSAVGGIRTEGPEYETIFALGSNILNDDPETLVEINEMCNDLGIDTMSLGVTLSWLMEASERGIIKGEYSWGCGKEILALIRNIVGLEGIGKDLSKGVKKASEIHGGTDYAIHVKGMELPGYDPRICQGMALAYATSNRGACHLRAPIYVKELFQKTMVPETMEGKVGPTVHTEDLMSLIDCLIVCRFASRTLMDESFGGMSEMLRAVTGASLSPDVLEGSMKRIWTMQRLYNIKQGMSHEEDTLPERFFSEELSGHRIDRELFNANMQEYYRLRDCDEKGVPTKASLRSLGII